MKLSARATVYVCVCVRACAGKRPPARLYFLVLYLNNNFPSAGELADLALVVLLEMKIYKSVFVQTFVGKFAG